MQQTTSANESRVPALHDFVTNDAGKSVAAAAAWQETPMKAD